MPLPKRATVYFDATLHKALRVKAAETDQSVSDVVNAAVRKALDEDADDLAAFRDRAKEPTLAFEDLVRDLKRRGKL
ncbi:MAG: CopG family transcriptional regulator [Gemmatimonadota bacterium]|nr:CopG family transcriptional regulator [Gemmatimonadota bacterium]